jgi:alpha-tubulin suppressor-like RCC1 family protein
MRLLPRVLVASSLAVAGALAAAPAATATAAAPPAAATVAQRARLAAGAAQWIHVSAGAYQTCGIKTGNTLWCWGYNHDGQLGDGNTASQDLPAQVTKPGPAGWASVAAGGFHGCGIRKDTSLWCWGQNSLGQLGIGSFTNQSRPQRVTSPAQAGWSSVAAGGFYTCATRSDGTLWCWGSSEAGQLGPGNTTDEDLPQQVTTPAQAGWASVAAGGDTTCATRDDGTLWCWGDNGWGQLGIGNTTEQDLPQQVTTPDQTGWASVSVADYHTCATRTDGTLWCWGFNDAGQLGIGSKTEQNLPQQVTTPAQTGWTSVAAGGSTTCATRTHALWCWGFNRYGQLGIGSNTNQARPRRVTVPGSTGWSLAAVGSLHACATHTGPTLWCWGYNANGQLGIGSVTNQDLPQQVTG